MLALILGLALAGEAPRELLRWDRAGIADFELWRLVSGHFVHLDLRHALLNGAGLLLTWALYGWRFAGRAWALIVLAGMVAVDAGRWFLTSLDWYVGASGVLHAAMAAGIAGGLLAGERLAWALALLGGAKLVAEYLGLSLPWMAPDAAVVTEVHLFGAAAGLLCGGWFGRRGGSRALFRKQ